MIAKQGIQFLKCPQCGGETPAGGSVCGYCGTAIVDSTLNSDKPDQIAPLAISREFAEKIAMNWLKKSHDDVPGDFPTTFKLLSIESAFWPFYYFTGVYSGWRRESTISGGVNELISVSKELLSRRCSATNFDFIEPPKQAVSVEELSRRAMNDLFIEMRGQAHLEFCRQVIQSHAGSPLKPYDKNLIQGADVKLFSQSFDAAQNQLKKVLEDRVKIHDIYFTQLSSKRIYWPFWTAEYRYKTTNYFLMIDAAGDGSYIGGYKPANPEKARTEINRFLDDDPQDLLDRFNVGKVSVINFSTDNLSDFEKFTQRLYPSDKQKQETVIKAGCFIATAAYGSEWTDEVTILRTFRDDVLMKTSFGKKLVSLYYRFSPALAKQIEQNELARRWTRKLLNPIVSRCRKYLER